MIKLIVFDLDGVLVSAKDIHYQALNNALVSLNPDYFISYKEHLSTYDGLPTKKKLELLTKTKNLPIEDYDIIWKSKQEQTLQLIYDMTYDDRIRKVLRLLKQDGYKIYVASNSIRQTIQMMLVKKGFIEFVDYFISNEDVKNPKPHTEIYLKCMLHAGVNPQECIVVEDSHIGRKSAINAGANLFPVETPEDVIYEKLIEKIHSINLRENKIPKWQGNNMKVLIPMAGAGRRFQEAGFSFPKPIIEIFGKTMIQRVVENLNIEAEYIFIVQKEHFDNYSLKNILNLIAPNCKIIQTEGMTEGAVCTTLLARDLINTSDHLLVANSDQLVEWDSNEFIYSMEASSIDGGILTFESTHPKWSYVQLDEDGYVSRVAEKEVISNKANTGLYWWRKGSDYVKYAEQMIEKNIRYKNEFYVAPVYNEAIKDGKKIKTFDVYKMTGLGDPESLKYYIENYK